jgi:hypothetical protein
MKRKGVTFLICLIISFALWYIIGYSQKETVSFLLSTQITGYPSGYVLTGQSEKEIEFQVVSSRHDVEKIKRKSKIAIDLSDIQLKRVKGHYQGVFPVEPFLKKYLQEINYNGYFELQSPETIIFFFETTPKD